MSSAPFPDISAQAAGAQGQLNFRDEIEIWYNEAFVAILTAQLMYFYHQLVMLYIRLSIHAN